MYSFMIGSGVGATTATGGGHGNRRGSTASNDRDENHVLWKFVRWMLGCYFLGLLLLSPVSTGTIVSDLDDYNGLDIVNLIFGGMRLLATGLLVGVAAAMVGGLLGFLFGMPRSFGREGAGVAKSNGEKADGSVGEDTADIGRGRDRESAGNWANNNLVEVSDWLTKIVVGVGLVQLGDIVSWIGRTGKGLGEGVGLSGPLSQSFGVAVILLNLGIGFIIAYLYARTTLPSLLATIHRKTEDSLRGEVGRLAEQQERQEKSTRAIQARVKRMTTILGGQAAIMNALYAPPPEGFEKAIEDANRHLRQEPKNGRVWGYLACGLGQKYRYELEQGRNVDDLQGIVDKAYKAVENALKFAPDLKTWLHSLWNPKDPDYIEGEDDLRPFFDDARLKERFERLFD